MWGLLADDDRLRVFAAVALGDRTVADICGTTGLSTRAVVTALARLESGGVLLTDSEGWLVDRDNFVQHSRALSPTVTPYEEEGLGGRQASVLRAFLRDGQLISIPVARSKRMVVLDHIAKVFELGVRYPERDVNVLLRAFHDDYVSLRRHLVDEGFLDRDGGEYWRSGGSVDL